MRFALAIGEGHCDQCFKLCGDRDAHNSKNSKAGARVTASLAEVRAMVGHRVGTSKWYPITQAMIDAHADISQDWQFIHVDPARAAQTQFGGTIAHGFLTLSMLSAMAYEVEPDIAGVAMGVNYGMNRMRFLAPVPAGARVRGHFTLLAFDDQKAGEITLTWSVEMEIENHSKPALVAEWINRRYLAATPNNPT